ncbi:hypothetical protein MKX01_028579 [Papaver californicum]|nr:hypothetical protein MKX01_028579 [Papaver californicum]
MVVILASTSTNGVSADGCEGDIKELGMRPSHGCCDIVRNIDTPCVCQQITHEIEQSVRIKKVIYVAQFCHKDLPHGTKCGSVTIPQAMKRNS